MNRTLLYSLSVVTAVTLVTLSSQVALSAGQSGALVRLQGENSGAPQTGGVYVTGRVSAGTLKVGNSSVAGQFLRATNGNAEASFQNLFPLTETVSIGGFSMNLTNSAGDGISVTSQGTGIFAEGGSVGVSGVGSVGLDGFGPVFGVRGQGQGIGVRGQSSNNTGVSGEGPTFGVYGLSPSVGVKGESTAIGVAGVGTSIGVVGAGHTGVKGESTSSSGVGVDGFASGSALVGVSGTSTSANGRGVVGSGAGTNSFGVYGTGTFAGIVGEASGNAYAGYFLGGSGLYTSKLTIPTSSLADSVLLGDVNGVASWGKVTNERIQDLTITGGKLANLTITGPKIADLAISTTKVGDLAISTSKVADSAISTSKVQDLAITPIKLANNAEGLTQVTANNFFMSSNQMRGSAGRQIALYDASNIQRLLLTGTSTAHGAQLAIMGANASLNVTIGQNQANANYGFVGVRNDAGTQLASMFVRSSDGMGVISAEAKSFVVPDPEDPAYNIVYGCIEGPEMAMYNRGTARLINGEARIVLPEHFRKLASSQGLTVVLTPLSRSSKGLGVEDKSVSGFTVFELGDGKGNYEFDWEIKAVRKDFIDHQPVQPWDVEMPSSMDKSDEWRRRLLTIEARKARAKRTP